MLRLSPGGFWTGGRGLCSGSAHGCGRWRRFQPWESCSTSTGGWLWTAFPPPPCRDRFAGKLWINCKTRFAARNDFTMRNQCQEFILDLSGLQGLVHAVKLGEDCSAGSVPFPWSHQAVLVCGDRPPQDPLKQRVISEEEPGEARTHSDLSC